MSEERSQFDLALKEYYEAGIAELLKKQTDNFARLGLLDSGCYVQTRFTRWQRLKAKVRNWWYDLRHSVCCSHEDY